MWENRAGLPVIQENVPLGDSCLPGNAFVYAALYFSRGTFHFSWNHPAARSAHSGWFLNSVISNVFCSILAIFFLLIRFPYFTTRCMIMPCPEDMLYSIFLLWKCPALSSSFFKLIFLCYWFTSKSCAGCDRIRTSKINVWRRNHQWKKDFLQPY